VYSFMACETLNQPHCAAVPILGMVDRTTTIDPSGDPSIVPRGPRFQGKRPRKHMVDGLNPQSA